jgi:hypothetical protein
MNEFRRESDRRLERIDTSLDAILQEQKMSGERQVSMATKIVGIYDHLSTLNGRMTSTEDRVTENVIEVTKIWTGIRVTWAILGLLLVTGGVLATIIAG